MKNMLLFFFISIFVLSCSSDDNDPFYGFKVENTTGIDLKSIKKIHVIDQYGEHQTSTKTALYGVKDGKIWISIFDNSTKEVIYEYTYIEKIPTSINRPYGEVFNVASFSVEVNEFGELIIISGEYLNYVPQDGFSYPNTGDSRLSFDATLISKKGYTRITNLLTYQWYKNSIICKVDKENVVFGQDGETIAILKNIPEKEYTPLSFIHGILITNSSFYTLNDYSIGTKKINEVKEITALIKEGKTDYRHIEYKIEDSNSSVTNIVYDITLITGEVTKYTLKIDMSDGSYQWIKVN